jgi:hypothetical protein
MRKSIFCLLLFISSNNLFCQKIIYSYPVYLREFNTSKIKLAENTSDNGLNVFSLFYRYDSVIRFVFNGEGLKNILHFHSGTKGNTSEYSNPSEIEANVLSKLQFNTLHSYLDDSIHNEVFTYNEKNDFYVLETNLNTKKTRVSASLQLDNGEKVLTSFVMNRNFVMITYFKKNDKLRVYKYKRDQKFTFKEALIEHGKLHESKFNFFNKNKTFGHYLENNNFLKVFNNEDYPLATLYNRPILYITDSILIFNKSDQISESLFYKINYHTMERSFDSIKTEIPFGFKLSRLDDEKPSSFFIDSFLIKIFINSESNNKTLFLDLYNINSHKLIKEFIFKQNDTFPFEFVKFNWLKFREEKVKPISFDYLFNKISKDRNALHLKALHNNEGLQISFGTFDSEKRLLNIALSVTLSALTTFAITSITGVVGYGIFIFYTKDGVEHSTTFNYDFKSNKITNANESAFAISKAIAEIQKRKTYVGMFDGVKLNKQYLLGIINEKNFKLEFVLTQ